MIAKGFRQIRGKSFVIMAFMLPTLEHTGHNERGCFG
jgi:hypothetical protein